MHFLRIRHHFPVAWDSIPSCLLVVLFTVHGESPRTCWADTFELKSGAAIEGDLLNPEQQPRTSYQIALTSGGEVTFAADDVKRVQTETPQAKQYRKYLKQMPADNANNHWAMAEWCRREKLESQRTFHLEQVIRHQPNHEDARIALRYKRQDDGSWVRIQDIWHDRGYVKDRGRWVLPQQVELDAHEEAAKQARVQWQKDIKMWRGWLAGRNHDKAMAQIMAIEDPLAAEPLAEMFFDSRYASLRESLAEILARLQHQVAWSALTTAAMEGDVELRIHCLKLLKDQARQQSLPAFVRELKSKDNDRVRRAGFALRQLGDDSTILPLIKAVRTTHSIKVGGNANAYNIGGPNSIGIGNRSKVIEQSLENQEVRDALVTLTREDFQFDQDAWSHWYAIRTTPRPDLRRDP